MDRTLLKRWVDAVVASRFLIGDPDEPGERVTLRVRLMTILVAAVSNAIGAGVVIIFALLVLPKPESYNRGTALAVNLGLAAAYILLALAVGITLGRRRVESGPLGTRAWLLADRPPTTEERTRLLRAPMQIMVIQLQLWAVATVLFTAVNFAFAPLLALGVGLTVALGGITTSTASYLVDKYNLENM